MLTLTLQEEQDQDQDQLAQKKTTTISFPIEIIQDILSRLPVKPILQFRSVSKPWFSLISNDPSFPKLHFTRSIANCRTAFFISAYDTSTNERHFLTAPADGGPVTHFITLHNARNAVDDPHNDTTEAEHLNGLVFFTSRNRFVDDYDDNFAFVVNPATRKVFKLPHPNSSQPCIYFFGFDESNNEHKILSITEVSGPSSIEFIIFSLSTYSWRKIHVEENEFIYPRIIDIMEAISLSVCVNSVIYLMDLIENQIWAFDLTTEKFSIINLPQDAIPHDFGTWFTRKGERTIKFNYPFLMNVNGQLGVVCHDRVVESNELHIWILQDYENRGWVRETITFSESWIELDGLQSRDYCYFNKLVFSLRRLSTDSISATVLDMNTRSFKLVDFNLGHQFLHSKTLRFHQVRSYVESLLPLREE